MSASDTTGHRICPVCGSSNSRLSLFCAECGASLNGTAPTPDDATPSDPQATQPIQRLTSAAPVEEERSPWAPPRNGSDQSTAAYQPVTTAVVETAPAASATMTSTVESPAITPGWETPSSAEPALVMEYDEPEESLRGFFFGVVATIIILIVAAIYVWTILPNGDLRDSIQEWVDKLPI